MITISKDNYDYIQKSLLSLMVECNTSCGLRLINELQIILETLKRQIETECSCPEQTIETEDTLVEKKPARKKKQSNIQLELFDRNNEPIVSQKPQEKKNTEQQPLVIDTNTKEQPIAVEVIKDHVSIVEDTPKVEEKKEEPVKEEPTKVVTPTPSKVVDSEEITEANLLNHYWKKTEDGLRFKRKIETYRSSEKICYVYFEITLNEGKADVAIEMSRGSEKEQFTVNGIETYSEIKNLCTSKVAENMQKNS